MENSYIALSLAGEILIVWALLAVRSRLSAILDLLETKRREELDLREAARRSREKSDLFFAAQDEKWKKIFEEKARAKDAASEHSET